MDVEALKTYALSLKEKLVGKRLSRFVQLDVHLFVCRIDSSDSLVIALTNGDPRIYVGKTTLDGAPLSTTFSSLLRKNYSNALVKDVSHVNNDRIIRIDMTMINEVFKPVEGAFIIELLPSKPNFILIEEGKILYGLKMTTLDHPHPIVKGIAYIPPEAIKGHFIPKPFDEASYLSACYKKEEELIGLWRKRKYALLYNEAKNLKKSANRKLILITKDIIAAQSHMGDADLGTLLLTYANDISCASSPVVIDGVEIPIDTNLSASKNAENYFHRYKKAKATIAMEEQNLARASKRLEEAEAIEFALQYGDDALLEEWLEEKSSKKRLSPIEPLSYIPYVLEYEGTRIYVGKNSNQNDFLTFHYGKNKEFYWFHVKDKPGSHVLVEEENPTNEIIEFCSEVALLGSKLTAGEVQYCKKKSLRKGKTKGQVILGAYQSIYIRSVKEETKKAFAGLVRAKIK